MWLFICYFTNLCNSEWMKVLKKTLWLICDVPSWECIQTCASFALFRDEYIFGWPELGPKKKKKKAKLTWVILYIFSPLRTMEHQQHVTSRQVLTNNCKQTTPWLERKQAEKTTSWESQFTCFNPHLSLIAVFTYAKANQSLGLNSPYFGTTAPSKEARSEYTLTLL